MSASNPTAFCPRCNQQVLLVRKEFDTCLAIVLLFTGIGIIIYIAVYYSRKEEFCIHCQNRITFSQGQVQFQPQTSSNISAEEVKISTSKYCPLCGEKLGTGTTQIKFCPNCGGEVI